MILNPILYGKLKTIFGEVKVSNMGEPLSYHFVIDPRNGKRKLVIDHRGEAYCVNCPYCVYRGARRPDQKFRLYINHRWLDVVDGVSLSFLVKCYNEDCLQDPRFLDHLKFLLFSGNRYAPVYYSLQDSSTHQITLPCKCVPLLDLPFDHPARQFLIDRGFDLEQVLSVFSAYFCVEFDNAYPLAFQRIILPCTLRGKLLGWQGRKIVEDDTPKYYTAKHSKLAHTLYGFDQFPRNELDSCFLVEGIFDVWAIGRGALGLFGTHLSTHQLNLLKELNLKRVYILLDADAEEKALKIVDTLRSSNINSEVFVLEEGDPADLLKKERVNVKSQRVFPAVGRG